MEKGNLQWSSGKARNNYIRARFEIAGKPTERLEVKYHNFWAIHKERLELLCFILPKA